MSGEWNNRPTAQEYYLYPVASITCRCRSPEHKAFRKTLKFGGCPPPPMWDMQHRAKGLRITKCHPSAVRGISREFCHWFLSH